MSRHYIIGILWVSWFNLSSPKLIFTATGGPGEPHFNIVSSQLLPQRFLNHELPRGGVWDGSQDSTALKAMKGHGLALVTRSLTYPSAPHWAKADHLLISNPKMSWANSSSTTNSNSPSSLDSKCTTLSRPFTSKMQLEILSTASVAQQNHSSSTSCIRKEIWCSILT